LIPTPDDHRLALLHSLDRAHWRRAHRHRRSHVHPLERTHRRISGVLGGLFRPTTGDIAWRLAFLAGLIGAPLAYELVAVLPKPQIAAGYGTLTLAGLLVGIGTRYGSGCTSGHGVCGLSRLSPRSMAATLAFMAAGFVTVFVIRHLLGI